MAILLKNIKSLLQVREDNVEFITGKDMSVLPKIDNAYLVEEKGLILDFGRMNDCPKDKNLEEIDASGRIVMPGYCDSHTHLVFAGNREDEFVDKINGLSYEEIAERGGGILNSAKTMEVTSAENLFLQSSKRLESVMKLGTTSIEIKSGYGLYLDAELKMLRTIQKLKKAYPLEIRSTFLAAHAIPAEFGKDSEKYVTHVIDTIMPQVAKEGLADYVDVFCEKGYFSVADMERVLEQGKKYNWIPKVHVNQFNAMGAVSAAVKHNALSVDHLEVLEDADIDALKGTDTIAVALPACSYFLGIPYTPVRRLMDANVAVAIASDYNPGSSPTGNMNFVLSAACIKLKMTPEEAINAATLNGAYAMGLSDTVGSITVGKKANLILTKPVPSYNFLPYAFGENHIERVFIEGKEIA